MTQQVQSYREGDGRFIAAVFVDMLLTCEAVQSLWSVSGYAVWQVTVFVFWFIGAKWICPHSGETSE